MGAGLARRFRSVVDYEEWVGTEVRRSLAFITGVARIISCVYNC